MIFTINLNIQWRKVKIKVTVWLNSYGKAYLKTFYGIPLHGTLLGMHLFLVLNGNACRGKVKTKRFHDII